MSLLALNGGPKSCDSALPSWPHYEADEIKAVTAVLRSGKVNQWTGPTVREFELACAAAFGQPHAVAVANGTLALELALIAAGIGPGDEVIVTPRSFIASASCVPTVGATPVFADVDIDTQTITPASIEAVISPRTKAVIPVHLDGWPCDMPGITAVAEKHGLYVIEDCAQAHGATIDGRPVGSFGHAAAFSFCQDKIISTGGEGGLSLFRDEADWRRAWSHKDHGKSYDLVIGHQEQSGFRWLHEQFGSNWRLTSMQAAIGLRQLKKLPDWHQRRMAVAQRLRDCLSAFAAISVPQPRAGVEHACYRVSFQIEEAQLKPGWDRSRIMAAINAEGVPCREVCPEIYREKAFGHIDMPTPHCPNAIALKDRALQLICHHRLDDDALTEICAALRKVMTETSL